MEKRYQVFVSSTFQDLQEERQEVMHALLELDCMPSGMELFPAADATQWNLIKKVINDCDYYILILGGRYGSLGPDGISYTEMEYRYALEIGKPTIAFLHKDTGKIIAERTEATPEGKQKLKSFREIVEKKLCKHWSSAHELGSVVSRSLIQLMKSNPAIGWVRATELADEEATMELLKLRKKVDSLESDLAKSRTSAPSGSEGLASGNELHQLRYEFLSNGPNGTEWHTYKNAQKLSWNDIFSAVAPSMIQEASDHVIKRVCNSLIAERAEPELRNRTGFTNATIQNFVLNLDDLQTIKVQLRALGLIVMSTKPRSIKDVDVYWTLTPYGDEVMTRLRAIRSNETKTFEFAESAKDLKKDEDK